MTLKKATAILSVALCGCLLSGCSNSATSASSLTSPPSTSDDESSSAATSASDSYKDEESTSVVSSSILPPTEEPNTPDSSEPIASPAESEQEYTDLSFLSVEQRQLYTNAYDASFGLYGEGANLMDQWGYKVVTDGSDSVPFIEDHYILYDVSFDEFSERIRSIFTDNCLASTNYAIKFKNYNGRVAVHFSLHNEMIAGMAICVQEQYPDTYRLVKNTAKEVEFTLISHYDRDDSVENPLEVYTIEYPIRMVKTDDGWRIDEFHTSRYG